MYVLSDLPYTSASLWIQLLFGGVSSVNGQTGAVSLTTDDIAEGTDKYFASGVAQYKNNTANQTSELLKLDSNGYVGSDQINPQFAVSGGSILLDDNQVDRMTFRNSGTSDPVLSV